VTNERRVVESQQGPARRSGDVQGGERRVMHEGQKRQHDRLDHLEALGDEEQVSFVVPVGDGAGADREEQERAVLGGHEQPDGQTAVGEVQHQQRQGHGGEPVAGVGDRLPDEEQTEVPGSQGPERAADGCQESLPHVLSLTL